MGLGLREDDNVFSLNDKSLQLLAGAKTLQGVTTKLSQQLKPIRDLNHVRCLSNQPTGLIVTSSVISKN
jgi:hypothetical protein